MTPRPGTYKYVHEALVADYLGMGWEFATGNMVLYAGEYIVYILYWPCQCPPRIHTAHRRKKQT